jgi:hypothetical protein
MDVRPSYPVALRPGKATYENGTCEPEDSGEENKGYIGFQFLAGALFGNITPIEDGAAVEGADELKGKVSRVA